MTVGSVGGGYTTAPLDSFLQTTQTSGIPAVVSGIAPDSSGGTYRVGSSGDSARLSGPAVLFAQLQDLLAQDPAKFQQVTATIATQLQAAAQQTTGDHADFLTNLADKFQTASTTGDVSGLQPHHRHHGHHVSGTYNQQGQIVPATIPATPDTTGADLKQLFQTISNEVTQALTA